MRRGSFTRKLPWKSTSATEAVGTLPEGGVPLRLRGARLLDRGGCLLDKSGAQVLNKSGPPAAAPREGHGSRQAAFAGLLVLVQVVPQDLRPRGVAQLGHGLGFDLADPLTGDSVDLADFV